MRAFKHVDTNFADAFESGESIKLGTSRHYRSLEGDRADPHEGLTVSAPGRMVLNFSPDNPRSAAQDRAFRSLGIDVGPEVEMTNTVIENCQAIYEVPQAYLFCCSAEPDWSLIDKGQVVFEITALNYFAKLIARAAPLEFGHTRLGKVVYADRKVDTLYEEPPVLDPFFKSPACAREGNPCCLDAGEAGRRS